MSSPSLPRAVWIPILALSIAVFGWRLSTVPITGIDEGMYANVSVELSRTHTWTQLSFLGTRFLEKPPLQFWLTAPVVSIIGPTELAMRFWTFLAAIGTALLITTWAWQLWKTTWLAWLAGGLFLFGRFAQVHAFRTGDLDGLLTLFITLVMYAYWRATLAEGVRKSRRWLIAVGAATGLAVITKSVAGLLPLLIITLDIIVHQRWRQFRWSSLGWAALTFVIIAAPWHAIETVRFGRMFWNEYIGFHVLQRTTESLYTATSWNFYFSVLRTRFFPFSLLLPLAMIVGAIKIWRDKSKENALWLLWVITTFLIFTFIQTRYEWYILPLYPAAILLVTQLVRDMMEKKHAAWFWWLSGASLFGMLYYLPLDIIRQPILWRLTPFRFLPISIWQHPADVVAVAIVSLIIMGCLSWALQRWLRRWTWSFVTVALVGIGCGLFSIGWTGLYIWHLPSTTPIQRIATKLQQLSVYQFNAIGISRTTQPAALYYLQRFPGVRISSLPAGTLPSGTMTVTTTESINKSTVAAGKILLQEPPFVLLAPTY